MRARGIIVKWTLSVPRSEQFSENIAQGKLWASRNIMSKDKYPSIFSPQIGTIVFTILQIFYATHAILKIGVYSRISPSFSCGIFGHVTCLDQSCTSEKIWWIISMYTCTSGLHYSVWKGKRVVSVSQGFVNFAVRLIDNWRLSCKKGVSSLFGPIFISCMTWHEKHHS